MLKQTFMIATVLIGILWFGYGEHGSKATMEGGGGAEREGSGAPAYGVTTSWLECGLRDLMEPDPRVVRLAPPGTCPGHFDISPGKFEAMRGCRLLFAYDFQQALGEKLEMLAGDGLKVVKIDAPEGLSIPASYAGACEAMAMALTDAEPEREAELLAALTELRKRLAGLELEAQGAIGDAGLRGARVVSSGHQSAFCRWLGLEVVAEYSGGESASPRELEALIESGRGAGVRLVVANAQEGVQMGEALSWQLGAGLAVLSNFPAMTEDERSFEALVRKNVNALTTAAARADE